MMNRSATRIRVPNARKRLLAASLVVSLVGLAGADQAHADIPGSICELVFYSHEDYPMLPDWRGLDVYGQDSIVLFLQSYRAVVQLDGCLYEIDRPLEIDVSEGGPVSLLIELPDHSTGAQVYVTTEGGVLLETLDVSGGVFEYGLSGVLDLGFEIVDPGVPVPTVPVVITKPIEDDPDPK